MFKGSEAGSADAVAHTEPGLAPWVDRAAHAGKYGSVTLAAAAVLAFGPAGGLAYADSLDADTDTSTSSPSSKAGTGGAAAPAEADDTDGDDASDSEDTDTDDTGIEDTDSDDTDSDDTEDADDSDDTNDVDTDDGDADETDGPSGSPNIDHDATGADRSDREPELVESTTELTDGGVTAPPRQPASEIGTLPTIPVTPVPVEYPVQSVYHEDAAAVGAPEVESGAGQPRLVAVAASVDSPLLDTRPAGAPAEPPFVAALLEWVRRSFFNQSPEFRDDPTTVQGAYGVVTGQIGAVDPEGDRIFYKVVKGPQHGTVTIDPQTGTFTYTPDLDFAQAGGTDTFVVRVTDNIFSLRDLVRRDHGNPRAGISLHVESILPSGERFIVPLPDDILQPQNAVFTADGTGLVFRATPQGGTRSEIYRVNLDGTGLACLTLGLAPEVTVNLSKPFVFDDGNRVLLSAGTQSDTGGETAEHYILECAGGVSSCGVGSALLKINVPTAVAPGVTVVQKQRELRVAPDGEHVGFTQLLAAGPATQLVASVGTLQRTETGYDVVDARAVYVGGELKNFTQDGSGVIVTDFSGKYEAGNADNVLVDLRTGQVSRLTANLDYDESVDMSPNGEWLAVGSSRTKDYLTPMSQIVRPTFVPAYVVFPTFQAKKGTLNEAWVVSREDELNRENGLFLGDPTGAYNSVPVANWSPDGTSVAFWERSTTDPTDTRLVVAELRNIDGGTMPAGNATPDTSSWAPALATVVPKATPLEPAREGRVGGRAEVTTTKVGNITTTTVTYVDFEDEAGMILNGTETTTNNPSLTNITYTANIVVSGADGSDRGYLRASNVTIANQLSMTGTIESSLDGNHLTMGTPA